MPATNLYRQVADDIAAKVEAGRLPIGALLPATTKIAVRYGVSPGTVARALRELENEHVLRRDGRYWFVGKKPSAARRMLERRASSTRR